MSVKYHYYLPTAGEVLHIADHPNSSKRVAAGAVHSMVRDSETSRRASLDYLTQICLGAEYAGCDSILVPIGVACEDPMVAAASLIARTRTLKFLTAVRTSLVAPVMFAQAAASFQRLSGNRLALNVTPGLPGKVSTRYGVWSTKQELLDQAGEFLTIMRGVWGDRPFDFEGKFFRVEGGSVAAPEVPPRVFYAGSSEESMRFAAKYADVYVSYIEPPEMFRERIERVHNMAADEGRTLTICAAFTVTARAESDEAWDIVKGEMAGYDLTDEALRASVAAIASQGYGASGARQRLLGALGDDYSKAEISPNLWIGQMLVQAGRPPALVGSYDEVADRFEEFARLGVDEFLPGGGTPALESGYRFAENIVPRLRARGLLGDRSPAAV